MWSDNNKQWMRVVILGGLLLPTCGCGLAQWAENGFRLGPNMLLTNFTDQREIHDRG